MKALTGGTGIATHCLISTVDGVWVKRHASATLLTGIIGPPLYRRLGRP